MTSPQGVNIGNAQGSITLSPDGVRAGVAEAKQTIQSFIQSTGQSLQKWGSDIQGIGLALGKALAPAVLAGGAGLKVAADFDSVMKEIEARTGLTKEAMDEIAQTSKDLGAATIFSSQQVADAFLQMLTAGMSTEQALAALPSVLDAAAAGNMDLGRAADLATNVLSVFQLQAEDTGKVVDALARASASSPATMDEMGLALQTAGAKASQFGLDVDQTSAALAIMANNGKRGTEAGNGFNAMLRNIDPNRTPAVAAAWEELGVALYDAQGNVRDLDLVFGELDDALSKLPVEDQNRLIQELAGSEGAAAFNALLATRGIKGMQEQMAAQRSASEVAADMMESFNNQVGSLIGSMETLGIEVMTPFMNDVLLPLIKRGIETVNMLSEWAKNNQDLVKTIVTVIAVLSAVAAGMVAFGQVLIVVGGLITALASPIGLVVLAVGALAAAFVTDFGGIRSKLQPIIDGIMKQLSVVKAWFENFGIGKGFQLLFTTFEDGSNVIGEFLRIFGMTEEQAFAVGDAINRFVGFLAGMFNRVRAIVQTIFSSNPFEALFNLIDAGFNSDQAHSIVAFFWTIRNVIASVFQSISDAWTNTLQPALDTLFAYFSGESTGGTDFLTSTINGATWLLRQLGDILTQYIIPGLAVFVAWIISNIPVAFETLKTAWETVLWPALSAIGNFITSTVIPALTKLYNWFVVDALPVIVAFMNDVAIPAFNTFIDILTGIWSVIQPELSKLWDWFMTTGLPAIKTFIEETVIPAFNTFIDILKGIWTVIQPELTKLWDWFVTTSLPAMINFINNTVIPGINNLINLIKDIWIKVQPGLENFKTGIQNIFEWILNNVINPFLDTVGGIGNTINNALSMVGIGGGAATATGTTAPNPRAVLGGSAAGGTQTQRQADPNKLNELNKYSNILQRVVSGSIDAVKVYQDLAKIGGLTSGIGQIMGQALQAIAGGADGMKAYKDFVAMAQNMVYLAQGTNFVPNMMPAMLHPGEAVIPARYNPDNPNAQSNGLKEGKTFQITIENIHATSAVEGAKAGEAFGDKLMERLRAHGVV